MGVQLAAAPTHAASGLVRSWGYATVVRTYAYRGRGRKRGAGAQQSISECACSASISEGSRLVVIIPVVVVCKESLFERWVVEKWSSAYSPQMKNATRSEMSINLGASCRRGAYTFHEPHSHPSRLQRTTLPCLSLCFT